MRLFFYLRVFFISFEFLILAASSAAFIFFGKYSQPFIEGITPNSDALKWVIAYPLAIVGWIFKEGVGVIFPDDKTSSILHRWPDFWKLKAHFNVGLFYCVILVIPCVIIWLVDKTSTYYGAWAFITCSVSLSINAYSFYSAKIHLKSVLIQADVQ